MKKMLYIGNFFSWKLCYEKNNSISIAANKWQENFFESLEKKFEIKKISFIQSAVFPKGRQIYFPSKKQKELNNKTSELISYINIPLIKKISIFIGALIKIFNLKIWNYEKVMIYNIYSPIAISVLFLKNFFKFELIFLVLDIVPGDEFKRNKIRNLINNIEYKLQKKLISKADKLIVINKLIIEDFNLNNKKNHVLEGGVSEKDILKYAKVDKKKTSKRNKILTYTGTLNDINGIEFLIKAFIKLERKNYTLEIYGQGPLEKIVEKYAQKYNQIKFLGFLENEEIIEVQKKSDLLIIPRQSEKKVLRYTFPSKLFEYMLSGTPVLSTKLPGIPETYRNFVYEIDPKNELEFSLEIDRYLSLKKEILIEKGQAGKSFIENNKLWETQGQKATDFLYD